MRTPAIHGGREDKKKGRQLEATCAMIDGATENEMAENEQRRWVRYAATWWMGEALCVSEGGKKGQNARFINLCREIVPFVKRNKSDTRNVNLQKQT
jgi:hypothetical protein